MEKNIINLIQEIYKTNDFIPLHAPTFNGNELNYTSDTIKSTYVSSVGKYVDRFESDIQSYTNSPRAVATTSGTAALDVSMHILGIKPGDYVITQALTFVATCNVIHHRGAEPILLDISNKSLSLCPIALEQFLEQRAIVKEDNTYLKENNKRIAAVVPMHTFGHPAELDEILEVCKKWKLPLIEDAAESLGSFYKGKHTGTIGDLGAISFNGNKIITTGGGGMVLCSSKNLGTKVKHITTTAKVSHPFEFFHDEPGHNYRLPNINAALGCAQMESLDNFLQKKRSLANIYKEFFSETDCKFVCEPEYAKSNYWLNAIICPDKKFRDKLLKNTNNSGVMTRPVWKLMHKLPMFKNVIRDSLKNSEWIEKRLVNLPSSPMENF